MALTLALSAAACSGGFLVDASTGSDAGGSSANSGTGGSPTGTGGGSTDTGNTGNAGGDTPNGGTASACVPLADFFAKQLWTPVLVPKCSGCHSASSVPDFVLDSSKDASAAEQAVIAEIAKKGSNGMSLVLTKPIGGDNHTGRSPLAPDSDGYKALTAFVNAVEAKKDCVGP